MEEKSENNKHEESKVQLITVGEYLAHKSIVEQQQHKVEDTEQRVETNQEVGEKK